MSSIIAQLRAHSVRLPFWRSSVKAMSSIIGPSVRDTAGSVRLIQVLLHFEQTQGSRTSIVRYFGGSSPICR